MDAERFKNCSKWRGNNIANYRLILDEYLDESIKKCVYLDADMLVLKDLRELFNIDLGDNILGVVLDWVSMNVRKFRLKDKPDEINSIKISEKYFNSGMLYINLELYRKEKIKQKSMKILEKYNLECPDQDALNFCIPEKTLPLPQKYNFLNFINPNFHCKDSGMQNFMPYTKEQSFDSLQNLCAIHLHTPKPWSIYHRNLNNEFNLIYSNPFTKEYLNSWWEIALQTPIFKDELTTLRLKLLNDGLEHFSKQLAQKLKLKEQTQQENLQKHNKNLEFLRQENTTLKNQIFTPTKAEKRLKEHLAFQIGQELILCYKKANFLRLAFTLPKILKTHKKQVEFEKILKKTNPILIPKLRKNNDLTQISKVRNYFTYKLGLEFLKASRIWYKGGFITFYFRIKKLKNLKK